MERTAQGPHCVLQIHAISKFSLITRDVSRTCPTPCPAESSLVLTFPMLAPLLFLLSNFKIPIVPISFFRPCLSFPPLSLFSNFPQWRIPHLPQIIRYSHWRARLIPPASITPRVTLLPFTSTGMFFSLIVAVYIPHSSPPTVIINGLVLHYGH